MVAREAVIFYVCFNAAGARRATYAVHCRMVRDQRDSPVSSGEVVTAQLPASLIFIPCSVLHALFMYCKILC